MTDTVQIQPQPTARSITITSITTGGSTQALDVRATAGHPRLEEAMSLLSTGDMLGAKRVLMEGESGTMRHAPSLCLLGRIFHTEGRQVEAEHCLRQSLVIEQDADTALKLAAVQMARGDITGAVSSYRLAIGLGLRTPNAYNDLGYLESRRGANTQAEQCYREAIRLDESHVLAMTNLAQLLRSIGKLEESESYFKHALELSPDISENWVYYGLLLRQLGRVREAIKAFRRGGRWELVAILQRESANWVGLSEAEARVFALIASGQAERVTPWLLLGMPGCTAANAKEAGRQMALSCFPQELALPPLKARGSLVRKSKIRIGYLSADFYLHATMHLLSGVLEFHDTERFEIHLYSYSPIRQDEVTERIAKMPVIFHEISTKTDLVVAQQIAADDIDILVDLKGYTADARLGICALRPAPVIVSWLGYPGSLGHPRLADYVIGDPIVTPSSAAASYSETLAIMPHCYQPNDHRRRSVPVPTRAQVGLPETGVVFCSFNQTFKFDAIMFSLWCRILTAVPGSVLWLMSSGEPDAAENLRNFVAKEGFDPARLIFAPRLPRERHLARLQLADIALDTFPYGSHTTGSDALWAGVPMVTLLGEQFAARVGASLLASVNLEELVATSAEGYFDCAFSLATHTEERVELRNRLIIGRESAPLFDTRGFTKDLERMYEEICLRESGSMALADPLVLMPENKV